MFQVVSFDIWALFKIKVLWNVTFKQENKTNKVGQRGGKGQSSGQDITFTIPVLELMDRAKFIFGLCKTQRGNFFGLCTTGSTLPFIKECTGQKYFIISKLNMKFPEIC